MIEREDRRYDNDDERITKRTIDGVSVLEKETHSVIKLVGGRYVEAGSKREPRLVVIDDAASQPRSLITRDRSHVAGLNAFISGAFRSPATSK